MEEFKQIPNTEGRYSISTYGRVFSQKSNRYLKHYISPKNKIHQVKIYVNNENVHSFSVAKLMAITFLDNPNPSLYTYAIHKDGNLDNLHISNIMWGTSSLSVRMKLERHPELNENPFNGKRAKRHKMTKENIEQLYIMRDLGYSCKQLEDIFPIKKASIFKLLAKREKQDKIK